MFHVEHAKYLTVKDHLVSGENFEIHWEPSGEVAKTHPQPKEDQLPSYYASAAYVSHQNSSRSLVDVLYRIARYWMMQKKEQWIRPFINTNARILDFGCGTGAFMDHLGSKGIDVHGVEPSSVARANAPKHLKITQGLNQTKGSFDLISLWHVLEHLTHPQESINALKAKLSPNGCLVVALPNFRSWDAQHYKAAWAAWDVPRHLWHFSPRGITALMEGLGFELMHKRAMPLDALYISYLSEKHKRKTIPLLIGILKGLFSNVKAKTTGHYSSQIYFFKRKS